MKKKKKMPDDGDGDENKTAYTSYGEGTRWYGLSTIRRDPTRPRYTPRTTQPNTLEENTTQQQQPVDLGYTRYVRAQPPPASSICGWFRL